MPTSAISVTVGGGGYQTQSDCSTLAAGTSCMVRLKPTGSGAAIDTLTVSASWGGSASAGLRAVLPTSCLALKAGGGPSGVYTLTSPSGTSYEAWCDMTTDGGGWTLVMRLDSATDQLPYDAPQWTTTQLLNPSAPRPATALGQGDAKYESFNSVTGNSLKVTFVRPGDGYNGYTLRYDQLNGRSAREIFAGGTTTLGGNPARSCHGAMFTVAMGYNSNLFRAGKGPQFYGFNLNVTGPTNSKMRFGFASNDDTNASAAAQAGIGTAYGTAADMSRSYSIIADSARHWNCNQCGCYGSGASAQSGVRPPIAGNVWVR
jgi:hypothetical protein